MARQTAAALIPPNFTWQTLHDAAAGCRACELWKKGTQTVFGERLGEDIPCDVRWRTAGE